MVCGVTFHSLWQAKGAPRVDFTNNTAVVHYMSASLRDQLLDVFLDNCQPERRYRDLRRRTYSLKCADMHNILYSGMAVDEKE